MDDCTLPRRQGILIAAESLFAKKGYDGVSVDQIAAQAGVNKATIYYYYKSKQGLLDALIKHFMQDICDYLLNVYKEAAPRLFPRGLTERADMADIASLMAEPEEFIRGYIPHVMSFFNSRQDILRIMLMESLKDGENGRLLFRITDILQSDRPEDDEYRARLREVGIDFTVDPGVLVSKFFFGVLPIMFYAVKGDAWGMHYQMAKEQLTEEMLKLFQMLLTGFVRLHTEGEPVHAG